MASDDPAGKLPGNPPAGSHGQPPSRNQSDADAEQDKIPIYNQRQPHQDQQDDSSQQPNWRGRLQKLPELFARADFWLALFTFFLVIETAITIRVLTATDEALHKTADAQEKSTEIADRLREITEANERPWVGPGNAAIRSGVEKDKPLKFEVIITNSGRQPAILNTYSSARIIDGDEWKNEFYRADVYAWEADCIGRKFTDKEPSRLLFPGEAGRGLGYALTVSSDAASPPFMASEGLVNGDDVALLRGCFIYEAFQATRHTSFCYFYRKGDDAGRLSFCTVGQYAD